MEHTSSLLYQTALIVFIVSIAIKLILKKKWAIYILLLGGFLLTLSAIHRDNYLHPWDERYHALVAKNVMENPLEPKLYKDTLIQEFNYDEWYKAHIWLHKQPLFLWQMAATMHIFGDGLVGMRLNSAFMLLLFIFAVFKATDLYFSKSSFWIALLAAIQPYLLLLASGRLGMDHNDITFIAWMAVGFWGLMAYLKKNNWKWLVLIGVSVGFAMLTKWLAGSFILCVWGLHLLISQRFQPKDWLHLLGAGTIAFALFVPWQLYCYTSYPEIFMKEWEYNSRHLTEVIEEHHQYSDFHFQVWKERFWLVSLFFLLGVAFIFNKTNRTLNLSLVLSVLAVMMFYSLAKTRLPSYTLFLLPVVLFIAASFLERINLRFIRLLVIAFIAGKGFIDFRKDYLNNPRDHHYAEHQKVIKDTSEQLIAYYPPNTVIFNVPPMEFVEFMFYSDMIAYECMPRKDQVLDLKERGYHSVVLLPPGVKLDSNLEDLVEVEYVHNLR